MQKRVRSNGDGSICFHAKRKKQYEVQVTLNYEIVDGKLKRKAKSLGYYETKAEAKKVLAEFISNKEEYLKNSDKKLFTFEEIYNQWSTEKYKDGVSKSTISGYTAAFKAVPTLHKKTFIALDASDLKRALYASNKNYPTMRKIRLLFSQMYTYAAEIRLTTYDASRFIRFDHNEKETMNPNKIDRNPFTPKELELIFSDTRNENFLDTVKFMLYTGTRISEMMKLEIRDVDFETNFIKIRESKTESGRNRLIPIHKELRPILKKWIDKERKVDTVFFGLCGKSYTDGVYRRNYWEPYFRAAGCENHKPHDCRYSFKTYWARLRMDGGVCERILGHRIRGIEDYYNRPIKEMMLAEIDNLTFDETAIQGKTLV